MTQVRINGVAQQSVAEARPDRLTPERLRTIVESAHLNFLIGAGTSSPYFAALGNIEDALTELSDVDALQQDTENSFGALPLAGKNLFDRARVRIRAQRLGATSVSLTNGRLVYLGVEIPREQALKLKGRGAIVYPKTHKLAYPFHRNEEQLMPAALGVLEELGGDDEVEE